MFGSNYSFGQSTGSPFLSQPVFGQTNNATSSPFAPQPFGSTNPFGSQAGGSIFGGTSTGVFGTQSSSPLGSTSVFGASSSPAFASSTPTFGASSGSAFGNSSSAFGGSSVIGQKPAFGAFGSTTTQTSPFGSSFPQSQPNFGSTMFGSAATFGAPSQPAFGSSTSPAFGAQPTPAFGASAPAFGSSTATASPTFGSTSGGFGRPTSPFGTTSTTAFSNTATPTFGAPSAPSFNFGSSPSFGQSTPTFGAPSAPSFNFGSSPSFGQSTSTFGTTPSGTSSFGAQTSSFGAQTTKPAFGNPGFPQSTFGGQRGGSRVSPYSTTPETDGVTVTSTQPAGKLQSISAMSVYKDKTHEELRWEDYHLGDKGGPAPASQAVSVGGFGNTGFSFSSTPAFGQTSASPFATSTSSNIVGPKTSNTSTLFGPTSSATPSFSSNTTQAFGGTSSPIFSSTTTSGFGSPSTFGPSSAQATTSAFGTSFGFGNTQSSSLFQSSTLTQTSTPFGQTSSAFGQTAPAFGQFNLTSTPSTGLGNMFPGTSSLLNSNTTPGFGQATPSPATLFQSAQQPMTSGGFNVSNFGQSQSANSSGFGGNPGIFSNNTFGQSLGTQSSMLGTQSSMVAQVPPITNPFGTLPAMPQISVGHTCTSPSIQYGISSLPVVEKPAPVRISSLLTSRHLSQRRLKLPVRKYYPQNDGPKVAFFNNDEVTPSTPKADAHCVPRENPRALVIRPLEQWHSRSGADKTKAVVHENAVPTDYPLEKGDEDPANHVKGNHQETNGVRNGVITEKVSSYITLTGHRAGEAATVYEHGADIEALMPKLRHSDYFTEPRVQELAAKERAEPGFCRRVKDFAVGRNGYGSIKFFGETDVRRLDLESLVQFNNREVIVYMDESKKPPVGQGLNKPAEVTLLNIKCFDKNTGQQFTKGPRIEKYGAMLKRKAEDQGAEFVSYDPVKGEWKFRVQAF